MPAAGDIIFEISSSQRNGEGAFLDAKDGRILYIYSHCLGEGFQDDDPSSIAMRTSQDSGKTWSDERILFRQEEHNAKNIMSVSLLRMGAGDIGLFYAIRYGWHDTRLHLRRSQDEQ